MTLEIITSPRLEGVTHGFFTRLGGASSGVYAGLNCGGGSADQRDAVTLNRARVAAAIGVAPERLVGMDQTHSADVATITLPLPDQRPEADAMVTATPGVALSVLTADCEPVLFADQNAGVVGVAHAGWKGALGGVLDATIEAMEALGATRRSISAVIGPTISQKAYEVGPEFHDRFLAADSANARFFRPGAPGHFLFDLPGYGLHRLMAAGVGHAEWTGDCTYGEPERFYSFRRSVHRKEADYGRLIAVIRL
ncbi:MAG: polyphenol oxidase [Rhodobacterales bacterium]|nr:MAG: polyphenol oxidase [Rhodobacterales bacterium]